LLDDFCDIELVSAYMTLFALFVMATSHLPANTIPTQSYFGQITERWPKPKKP
jgi:hypothetical protein